MSSSSLEHAFLYCLGSHEGDVSETGKSGDYYGGYSVVALFVNGEACVESMVALFTLIFYLDHRN